jgi:peptidoglycan/LPS O-acetylase OafA/YrhL
MLQYSSLLGRFRAIPPAIIRGRTCMRLTYTAFAAATTTTSARATASQRLAFLDALRGIAALLVLVSHMGGQLSPTFQNTLKEFNIGHVGVVVFFLCSGYIIPVSLERTNSLRVFWVRRFFRLYPLYWASLLGAVILTGYTSIDTVLANATMLQFFMGFPHVNGLYWTLTLELIFYALISFLFFAKLYRHTEWIALILILAARLTEGLYPALTGGLLIAVPVGCYLAIMWAGTIIYRAQHGEIRPLRAWLLLILILIAVTYPPDQLWYFLRWSEPAHIPARLVGFAIFGAALFWRERRVARLFTWLGTISYSVYLLHPFVLSIAPFANPILLISLWVLLTLALASATYRWIEHPCIALGHKITQSRVRIDH